jgi:hypothetical protein
MTTDAEIEKGFWEQMDMIPIEGSKNVDAIGYNRDSQELKIRFKNGGLYAYDSVPPEAYAELMAAHSKGSHIHKSIKGKYNTRRLDK